MSDLIKTQERLRAAAVACEGWSWPDRMRDENGTHHFGKRRDGEFYEIGTIDASTYTGEYVDDIRVLKFIRAAQPEAILRLLGEVAELRAALIATQADLDEWRFTNRVDELERALVAANTALTAATAPIVAQPVVATVPPCWVPLYGAGQIKKGDKLRFICGGKQYTEKAKLILNPGTDKEEVIYNIRQNFYFITSMAVNGTSSHRNVEVFAAAPAAPTDGEV